jgi:hypothetical protein
MPNSDRLPPASALILWQEGVEERPEPLAPDAWAQEERYLSTVLLAGAEDLLRRGDAYGAYGAVLIADQALAQLWVRSEGSTPREILTGLAQQLRRLYLKAEEIEGNLLVEEGGAR